MFAKLLEKLSPKPKVEQKFTEQDKKAYEAAMLAGMVIVDWEEFRDSAYFATADEKRRGIYTVGFGNTVGVKGGDKTTYGKALLDLHSKVWDHLDKLAAWNPSLYAQFTAPQIAAIISLLYNVGETQFRAGETYKAFLRGDVAGMLEHGFDETKGFVKQSGSILRGLVDRRKKESSLLTLDLAKL